MIEHLSTPGSGEPMRPRVTRTRQVTRVRASRPAVATVFQPPACADCGHALRPVFADIVGDDGLWSDLTADGALRVTLSGGYGMAIDPLSEREQDAYTFLLCADCAAKFTAAHPWLPNVNATTQT